MAATRRSVCVCNILLVNLNLDYDAVSNAHNASNIFTPLAFVEGHCEQKQEYGKIVKTHEINQIMKGLENLHSYER